MPILFWVLIYGDIVKNKDDIKKSSFHIFAINLGHLVEWAVAQLVLAVGPDPLLQQKLHHRHLERAKLVLIIS